MKYTNKFLGALCLAAFGFASCADDYSLLDYEGIEQPVDMAAYEYLKDYNDLKTYVDRTASPNFKLGTGITASDYNGKGLVYRLANTNFDEVTPGNAMKHASVVANDGTMNFGTVTDFVSAAKEAGTTIYGHTLLWHAQQNTKYLNNLIAPQIIKPEKPEGSTPNFAMRLNNTEVQDPAYNAQAQIALDPVMEAGKTYVIKMAAKASAACTIGGVVQENVEPWPQVAYPDIDLTTSWAEYEVEVTAEGAYNCFCINFGNFVGDVWVDNVVVSEKGSNVNMVSNGDFESGNTSGWGGCWNGKATINITGEGEGYSNGAEPGFALKMTNTEKKTDNWAAQVWYNLPEPLTAGTSYTFTCMAKATEEYASVIFIQASADGAQDMFYGSALPITTQWSEVSITFQTEKTNIDKFTFNFGDFAGTIFIDDCKLVETGMRDNLIANGDFEAQHKEGWQSWGNYETLSEKGEGYAANASADIIIEKTPEEKEFLLTTALGNWIAGIMQATEGYVTSWDAVNEIISGEDADGDGFYDLRSASNADADTKSNFYWADYLGNETVVPTVIKMAHKYYAGDGNLKLFINDFNLESWWDDNKKLKSLIHWIEVWENSDIISIDGIGTQMHVSYILNEEDQKKQEAGIENMFKLMAATGKLVKISEIDMGVVEKAFGTGIKTENITEEMHMKMADFYQFIVNKYFEIIPANQQYGITHWCPTDSPANSGWRGGEPVGLWDKNYNRKHVYAGFADGLARIVDEEAEEGEDNVESAE